MTAKSSFFMLLVYLTGLEPAASGIGIPRSIQMGYRYTTHNSIA